MDTFRAPHGHHIVRDSLLPAGNSFYVDSHADGRIAMETYGSAGVALYVARPDGAAPLIGELLRERGVSEEDAGIPRVEIPDVILALGVLQTRLAGLQAVLAAGALGMPAVAVDEPERWLSVEEVAQLMGVSTSWLYKRWREKLPFGFRFGGKLVFPADKVRRFLASRHGVAAASSRQGVGRGRLLEWFAGRR